MFALSNQLLCALGSSATGFEAGSDEPSLVPAGLWRREALLAIHEPLQASQIDLSGAVRDGHSDRVMDDIVRERLRGGVVLPCWRLGQGTVIPGLKGGEASADQVCVLDGVDTGVRSSFILPQAYIQMEGPFRHQ
jgi:hypothetical protein